MDSLELFERLLHESILDIDCLNSKSDFILGLRMGYLQCIGVISEIKIKN